MAITQSNAGFSVATAVCLFEMAFSFSAAGDVSPLVKMCEVCWISTR